LHILHFILFYAFTGCCLVFVLIADHMKIET